MASNLILFEIWELWLCIKIGSFEFSKIVIIECFSVVWTFTSKGTFGHVSNSSFLFWMKSLV